MMPAHVTQHAVRRYAERVLHVPVAEDLNDLQAVADLVDRGIDVGAIRERLHHACDLAVDLGATAVKADGVRLMLKNGAVVTVLAKCSPGSIYGRNAA